MATMTLYKVVTPKPAVGSVITCRVCERKTRATLDAPALLCGECLADLDSAARHVAERAALIYARWQRECEAFGAMVKGCEWWEKVQEAKLKACLDERYTPTYRRAWEAARKGPQAAIVAAWEALDNTSAEVESITAWYTAAEEELRAARTSGLGGL